MTEGKPNGSPTPPPDNQPNPDEQDTGLRPAVNPIRSVEVQFENGQIKNVKGSAEAVQAFMQNLQPPRTPSPLREPNTPAELEEPDDIPPDNRPFAVASTTQDPNIRAQRPLRPAPPPQATRPIAQNISDPYATRARDDYIAGELPRIYQPTIAERARMRFNELRARREARQRERQQRLQAGVTPPPDIPEQTVNTVEVVQVRPRRRRDAAYFFIGFGTAALLAGALWTGSYFYGENTNNVDYNTIAPHTCVDVPPGSIGTGQNFTIDDAPTADTSNTATIVLFEHSGRFCAGSSPVTYQTGIDFEYGTPNYIDELQSSGCGSNNGCTQVNILKH